MFLIIEPNEMFNLISLNINKKLISKNSGNEMKE